MLDVKHGTRTAYVYHKCRCDLCREENRRYHNDEVVPRLSRREPPSHGTPNAYGNYRCRCEECREAHKVRCAEWRYRQGGTLRDVKGSDPPQ